MKVHWYLQFNCSNAFGQKKNKAKTYGFGFGFTFYNSCDISVDEKRKHRYVLNNSSDLHQ